MNTTGTYWFQNFHIREQMVESIQRYVEDGLHPGDFLTAVIQNDLSEACSRADSENLRNLPAFVAYFHNEVPIQAWGSKEKMKMWLEKVNKCQEGEEK